jgi:hypothetical protein
MYAVKLIWTKATTKGICPAPRDSHTCSAWNSKLVVVGGEDASDSYLADVHILDTGRALLNSIVKRFNCAP